MATGDRKGMIKAAVARSRTLVIASLALVSTPLLIASAQTPEDTSRAFREKLAARGIPVGSLTAVHRTKQYVLVDTHVNPSAGRLYVLSRGGDRVVAELPGWVVRILPNDIVLYHRNEVHFAPTHSAELWTWDPVTHRDVMLYSTKPHDTHLGDTIAVADSGRTVVFAMVFSRGDGTAADTAPREVVVTCRGIGTKRARCTEQRTRP